MIFPALDLVCDDGVVMLDIQARLDAEDLCISNMPRWRQLLGDVARLRCGWRPEASDLQKAPRLDRWSIIENDDFGLVRLRGVVTGHACLPDRRAVITSPLVAVDTRKQSWARTVSRLYVLQAAEEKPDLES